MELKEILKKEVNSALITCENHDNDNGFFANTIRGVEDGLIDRNYEPLGICKRVPFESSAASQSVAFVYTYDGEIYWCHMPETYWFSLLNEVYGYNKADEIVESILRK